MSEPVNRKLQMFWILLISMIISFSVTLIFEAQLTDEISIASGILTGIALFFTCIFILLETITDICNP
ncbi:hypothetical protein [Acinetobacter sp. ANC 4558]|uniref:hypothetical protein n=1 Tax=Acinetobacter sp. ANC 4558 TaxID=1977876 RepID=UPI00111C6360|nr:hypothetical protein [Acinetobacter sp. ANC 4558]